MFIIRWIWKNMEGYRRRCVAALFMLLIAQILMIFNPFIMRTVVDTFISSDNAAENIATQKNLLFWLIGLTIIINLVRTGIRYALDMMLETCSQGTVYRIRAHLFKSMQSQDADFYDLYRTGDIMTRLSGDIEMVRHTTAWSIKAMFESVICFLTVSIFYFFLNPYMALCMVGLTPLILVFSTMFHKKVGPMYGELRERLSELNTRAEENISGNRVVKAFAAEDAEIERFRGNNEAYATQSKNTSIAWWRFFLPMETVSQAILVVHLVAGGLFAIFYPGFTMGDYMAFSMLSWALSNPMSMLGYVISDLRRFTASANKIIEVYYSRSKIVDRADAVKLKEKIAGDIEFKNVSFGYGGGHNVLNNISFKVKAGQTVAVMGETGSGKTTLVNLIPRIYDVTKGEILVDGHNIRMMKLNDLRSAIGIATQEVLLFSDTIEGNISFGNSELSFEGVTEKAAMSDAHEFIEKTSDGYDTIVGERGVGLSGGQKQRIALARALAMHPSILILDDTTSAVDSETEQHIQNSLRGLPCTKIIIAARISSVKDADLTIVLKSDEDGVGRIAEMGTHDELIQNNGYYREVYDLQS